MNISNVDAVAKALAQMARANDLVRKAIPIIRAQVTLEKIAAASAINTTSQT